MLYICLDVEAWKYKHPMSYNKQIVLDQLGICGIFVDTRHMDYQAVCVEFPQWTSFKSNHTEMNTLN